MTKKEKRERLSLIADRLEELYPNAECALQFGGDPWKLLVMGRLSAQCTDARVNEVSVELFRRFPNAKAMMDAPIEEIEEIVKPCGLYRMKAKNLKDASRMLVCEFGGRLPQTMDELLRFPGVGRKIANLLIGDVFGGECIVCDTHCIRICGRFGMYAENEKNPDKIEKILRELIDLKRGSDFCHRIVLFGREICTARGYECVSCPMKDLCLHGERVLKKATRGLTDEQ